MLSIIGTRILDGFSDPTFSRERWTELLALAEAHTVNLTPEWQQGWWEAFGKGELLLTIAECDGIPVALAPFFSSGGMLFNICPEDGLDFVGDISNPEVLDSILITAREQVPDFVGFRLFFIPDDSKTGKLLQASASRLNLDCIDEGSLPSPWIDIAGDPEGALACTKKKSLVRYERCLQREGTLEVEHFREADEIEPHLDDFFVQHRARWAVTNHPSLFEDPSQRNYYRTLTRNIGTMGWLRFTRIVWNNLPIAFHFGLCYRGRFLWGIPSFDIQHSGKSPGQVLLRQTLLAAISEEARIFDFGIGAESYKDRFATDITQLRTWGLYPKGRVV